MIETALFISVLFCMFLFFHAEELFLIWLNIEHNDTLQLARYILLVIPLYVLTDLLRSPLDGLSDRGLNSIVYGVSASVFIAVFYGGIYIGKSPLYTIVIGFISGYFTSSLLSVYYINRILLLSLRKMNVHHLIGWVLLYFFYHQLLLSISSRSLGLLFGFVAVLSIISIYVWLHWSQIKTALAAFDEL